MPRSHSRTNRHNKRNQRSRHVKHKNNSKTSLTNSEYGISLAGSLVGASSITQGSELDQHHGHGQGQEHGHNDLMFGGTRSAVSKRRSGCANDIADHILCFLELLNTIKIYHWSTLSYPTHKATDELHTKMSELVDSFIEIYIGHCSRGKGGRGAGAGSGVPVFRFKSENAACIKFCECKSLETFCKVLDDNIVQLEGLTDRLNGYTDLVNIRDEMVGALAQALYLLRLK